MCATFLRNRTKPLPSRVIAYHLINYYLSQFSDNLSLGFKVEGSVLTLWCKGMAKQVVSL
jgi:hypothetical protein